MAQFRVIAQDEKLVNPSGPPRPFSDISNFLKHDGLIWIDIINPGEKDIDLLANEIEILHPVTLEDLTVSTREKLELFAAYSFLSIDEMDNNYNTKSLRVIVRNKLILTVHGDGNYVCISQVIKRLDEGFKKKGDKLTYDVEWIIYGLVDEIIDLFLSSVRNLIYEANDLDLIVLAMDDCSADGTILSRIAACRKHLNTTRTSLWAKQEILRQIIRDTQQEDLEAYLRDVIDHVIRMLEKISVTNDLLSNIGAMYHTKVSIEMGKHSEEMNETINRFSAVATIFLPLSVLTGLWGMNVEVPGQFVHNLYPFLGIASVLFIIAVIIGFYFHRRRWL